MRPILIASSLFLLLGEIRAEILVFDFEDPALPCAPSITVDGIRLTNHRGTICISSGGGNSVSNGTARTNDVDGLKLVHVHHQPFDVISMDLGEYSLTVDAPKPLRFTGIKADGATVTFDVTLDNLRDGPGGVDDFQTIAFPSDFVDLVEVQAAAGKTFSLDNIVIDGVIPPPLSIEPDPAFVSASLLRTQAILDNYLVVGSDFQYAAGFQSPTAAHYTARGVPRTISQISSPSFDPKSSTLVYVASQEIRTYDGTWVQTLLTPQEFADAGFSGRFSKPIFTEDRLYFCATRTHDEDAYGLFRLVDGTITPLVTVETDLPGPGSTGKPHYFPKFLAAKGDHFAFDSSIRGTSSIDRIFAGFDGSPLQLIASEGDSTPFGVLTGFAGLSFDAADRLEVIALIGQSQIRLVHDGSGLVSATALRLSVDPINAGKGISGTVATPPDDPLQILDTDTEIYRRSGDGWFRVIGVGDVIDGHPITYLSFLGTRRDTPGRIIVETRRAGDHRAYHYQIDLLPSVEQPPKFGPAVVHYETGDLYVPLSRLTAGRRYILSGSDDLKTWTPLWPIPEILPVQHVVIPRTLLKSPSFFRVEEVQ